MKKKHAFWAGLLSLLGIFAATLFMAPGSLAAIGPAVIAGIVGACGFYQGANVADNWQRSMYYREELAEPPAAEPRRGWVQYTSHGPAGTGTEAPSVGEKGAP
jgi:hypothetical protein